MKRILLEKKHIHNGNLILINKNYPLKIPEKRILRNLVGFGKGSRKLFIHRQTAKALQDTLNYLEAKEEIRALSGFRSKNEQTLLYNNTMKNRGADFTQKYVAIPDASEHQCGIAIDLGKNKKDIDDVCPDFPDYGIFHRFRAEAVKRGFIERYKKGKESITGICDEPWHFRYVGYPHSVIMEENNFALEEYHSFIKNYASIDDCYRYRSGDEEIRIFYSKCESSSRELLITDEDRYEVSGNNFDGFIITVWKATG